MATKLHFAENTLALHLFLKHLERLADIVVADQNLHALSSGSIELKETVEAARSSSAIRRRRQHGALFKR